MNTLKTIKMTQAPRSFWLSMILLGEVIGLSIFKPVWIFNLLVVGRLLLDFVIPGYFVPIQKNPFHPQDLPMRAPIHMRVPKSVGLG